MIYILAVLFTALAVILINFFIGGKYEAAVFFETALITAISIASVFSIDGILAFIIRRLPEKWFKPTAKIFSVGKGEIKFYRKTAIEKWKKYVPEWGCFTGFHKDRLADPKDSEYIGRFLLESNYGVAGHIAGAIAGFTIMLIPAFPTLTVALPIAAVNAILSILPTMILRTNTPPLRRLYKRLKERERKEKNI